MATEKEEFTTILPPPVIPIWKRVRNLFIVLACSVIVNLLILIVFGVLLGFSGVFNFILTVIANIWIFTKVEKKLPIF